MTNKKLLITSGCSFSECISPGVETWAKHLAKYLSSTHDHISKAMGSQGNGLISRGIVYSVTEALKKYKPEDLLVGIMWSGADRHDFHLSNPMISRGENVMENPTGFISETKKNWVIINWNWKDSFTRSYYDNFHSEFGSLIYSYEHILRVQWFLELNQVPYFMTTHTSSLLNESGKTNIETNHLFDQIKKDVFLPVIGEFEWCRDYSNLPIKPSHHPSNEQHGLFSEKIIVPYLIEKKLI